MRVACVRHARARARDLGAAGTRVARAVARGRRARNVLPFPEVCRHGAGRRGRRGAIRSFLPEDMERRSPSARPRTRKTRDPLRGGGAVAQTVGDSGEPGGVQRACASGSRRRQAIVTRARHRHAVGRRSRGKPRVERRGRGARRVRAGAVAHAVDPREHRVSPLSTGLASMRRSRPRREPRAIVREGESERAS